MMKNELHLSLLLVLIRSTEKKFISQNNLYLIIVGFACSHSLLKYRDLNAVSTSSFSKRRI